MDKKKLTRRVVLGSIAAGLGGTALVLRSLRGRYQVQLPSAYEEEWKSRVKLLTVPIEEVRGPETFALDFKPQGVKFRVLSLDAEYERLTSPVDYPQLPWMYSFADGRITGIPPIVDDSPALSIIADNEVTKSIDYEKVFPGGAYALVYKSGERVEYYEPRDHATTRIPTSDVAMACLHLAPWLKFSCPYGKSFKRGMKWMIPETSEYMVELPCEIVGSAKVNGRRSVKMLAERHLNNQEMLHYATWQAQVWKQSDEELKARIEQIKREEHAETFQVVAYVDLETGLVIRHEFRKVLDKPKAGYSSRHTIIKQAIES